MRIFNFNQPLFTVITLVALCTSALNAQKITCGTFDLKKKAAYEYNYVDSKDVHCYLLESVFIEPVFAAGMSLYNLVSFNHNTKEFEKAEFMFAQKWMHHEDLLSKFDENTLHMVYKAEKRQSKGYGLYVDFLKTNGEHLKSKKILSVSNKLDLANIDYNYSDNKKYLGVNSEHFISVYDVNYEKVFSTKTEFESIAGSKIMDSGELLVLGIKQGSVYLSKYKSDVVEEIELNAVSGDYMPYQYRFGYDSINNSISVVFLVGTNKEKKEYSGAHHLTKFEINPETLAIKDKSEIQFHESIQIALMKKKELISHLVIKDLQYRNNKMFVVLQKEYFIVPAPHPSTKYNTTTIKYMVHAEDIILMSFDADGSNNQQLISRRPTRTPRSTSYMTDPHLVFSADKVYLFYHDTRNYVGKIKYDLHSASMDYSLGSKRKKNYDDISSDNYTFDFSNIVLQKEGTYLMFGEWKAKKLGYAYLKL